MFKISEFSKLTYVSIKTLRYYDEIGLLKPAHVDQLSGYRYYSASQLPRLNRILALKGLGLSLEQIKQLLDDTLTVEQIRGMLLRKRVETMQRLVEEQHRLAFVESKLKQLEREGKMSEYEVIIKSVPAIRVASLRGVAPSWSELGVTLNQLFDNVSDAIVQSGAHLSENPAECGITRYLDTEYKEHGIHVEASFGVVGDVPPIHGVEVVTWSAVDTMASLVHKGAFSGLSDAYQVMMKWIEDNGYEITGANREINLEYERHGDPNQYVTEIQFPVKKK